MEEEGASEWPNAIKCLSNVIHHCWSAVPHWRQDRFLCMDISNWKHKPEFLVETVASWLCIVSCTLGLEWRDMAWHISQCIGVRAGSLCTEMLVHGPGEVWRNNTGHSIVVLYPSALELPGWETTESGSTHEIKNGFKQIQFYFFD